MGSSAVHEVCKRVAAVAGIEGFAGPVLQPLVRTPSMTRATPPTKVEKELVMKADRNIENDVRKAMTAAAGVLAHHSAAHAYELTPSLKNLLLSFVAGGGVVVLIAGVIIAVSGFDPVTRS